MPSLDPEQPHMMLPIATDTLEINECSEGFEVIGDSYWVAIFASRALAEGFIEWAPWPTLQVSSEFQR